MKKIISKSFYFEAAHKLSNTGKEENKNIHGHSYFVEIFIIDQANEINKSGLILDFSIFQNKLDFIKKDLDHRFLNDISGLENPTLENKDVVLNTKKSINYVLKNPKWKLSVQSHKFLKIK